MAAALRAARQSLQLLGGQTGWAAQQSSSFTSLTLGSWWQGTSSSPAAASAAALGWQRVTALIPSLADMQLLAAPKKKASQRPRHYPCQLLDVWNMRLACNDAFCQHTQAYTAPECLAAPHATPLSPAAAAADRPHSSQVSPHRKGKRSATKFIRFVPVVAQCSKCQRVFEQHAMPSKCEEDECPAFNLRSRPS